jgi:hypothetical protein
MKYNGRRLQWKWVFVVLCATAGIWACSDDDSGSSNTNDSDASVCVDRCQAGERQCVTGGYQPCGNFDDDECLEWGPMVPCNQGEQCVDGECEVVSVQDECVEGAVICTPDGTGTRACQYLSNPGVWIWGEETPCESGETCSCGRCRQNCVDECAAGSQRCWENGFQLCGNFDADSCVEWGQYQDCPSGQTCSNGTCSDQCTHECTAEALRCACSGNMVQSCGDFDEDVCLEWGPSVPCPLGESCSNGVCSSSCQDECGAVGETECNSAGTGYMECDDHNEDGCLEWGPVIDCTGGESCENGTCGDFCNCDNEPSICEAESPNTTTPCGCDPDCGTPCQSDGYCDDWCTPGADPDCGCSCDFNEYCEAEAQGSTNTCACDYDCEPHEHACMDDAHCDTWCPAGEDPDCGVDPCRSRWMLVGYLNADECYLSGSYDDPDPEEGAPWVVLSPGMSGGSAEIFVEMSAEHVSCVGQIKVEVWGYDDSTFGDGAEMLLYDWDNNQFELLPDETVGSTSSWYSNSVYSPAPYMLCGSGQGAKCYINAKLEASGWDNTHFWDFYVYVHMSP